MTAPTCASNTVTQDQDTIYEFDEFDFGFFDMDFGPFTSVRLDTLPSNGTLKLDGVGCSISQVVAVSDIDSNIFTFTPDTGQSGEPYATWTFSVNDSEEWSAVSCTMTHDVTSSGEANFPMPSLPNMCGGFQTQGGG